MPLPSFDSPAQPRKKVYYYRNSHGKVISLDEDIAFEQHLLHPEFLGSSADLIKTGFNFNEMIAKHLKENIVNPTPPVDKRKITNYSIPSQPTVDIDALKEQLKQELLKEIKNGLHTQEQKNETK